ncbi:MAG: zinc ribbon domain-containing protein [Clostridium sp.]|nr:zinc ribbon domain-containing protein [Clostridium sp.]
MANCIYCGQQISDGETACPYCGAAQGEQPVTSVQQDYGQQQMNQQMGYDGQNMQQWFGQQDYGQPMVNRQMGYNGQDMQQGYGQPQQGKPDAKKHKNGKKIGIIVGVSVALVIAALAVVFVVMFVGPGAPTQAAAVKSYIKSIIKQDEDDYLDACYPKQLQKENGNSNDDFEDEIEQMMLEDDYSDKDAVRKIKIIDEEKMDSFDVKELEDEINGEYNAKIKIEEIIFIEYECELKEGGEWEKDSNTITLYKTSGRWFVMEASIMNILYNGTYVLSEVSAMGMTFSVDEFEEMSGQKLDMMITVEGSKCILSADMAGMGVVGSGSARITFSGDTVTIENGSQTTITGTYDSEKETITLTSSGVKMVFKKK